jgi:hypothetical protein
MDEHEKITIIEGPPPTFEIANEPLLLGLSEGPAPMRVVMCHLRTLNGPALVERCYRAWSNGQTIRLEFKSEEGLTIEAPIVAARWAELSEGHLLMLWIRLEDDDVDIDIDFEFDDNEEGFEEDFNDEFDDSDFDITL